MKKSLSLIWNERLFNLLDDVRRYKFVKNYNELHNNRKNDSYDGTIPELLLESLDESTLKREDDYFCINDYDKIYFKIRHKNSSKAFSHLAYNMPMLESFGIQNQKMVESMKSLRWELAGEGLASSVGSLQNRLVGINGNGKEEK